VTYRVTWETADGAHEETFTDVDQGYDFYQQMQRKAYARHVAWAHVPW
jgi:hypothetical protein